MRASVRRCCGADEFIKLHAYTLTDYHRVVHLDADTLIFHPMDELMGRSSSLVSLLFASDTVTCAVTPLLLIVNKCPRAR